MKLADDRHEGLLAAEHACMKLARAVGLTTVTTSLAVFGGIEVLIVERYDRRTDPETGAIRRIHQEDSCQALGINIDANQGRGKYEQFGGPSFAQIADLLDRYGDPIIEHPRLLRTVVFTSIIGNADAHGKNVSLLLDTATGVIELAPLYDTVPTTLWPKLRAESAMSINHAFVWPSFDDLIREANQWGMRALTAERVVNDIIVDLRRAIASCDHIAVTELVCARLDALDNSRTSP
jgi:serine/threonine-protein kinase HipA